MAIYTKKGDRGETSLYDESYHQKIRVPKNSLRIKAIGGVDETNSFLGIVGVVADKNLKRIIESIQKDLFCVGSILAGARLRFSRSKTKELEKLIDKLEEELPPLKNFILPGGTEVGARLHYARTLARWGERSVVALSGTEQVKPEILTYLNRLSDFLFMLARKANYGAGVPEKVWKMLK